MIELVNIQKKYQGNLALKDISLQIAAGEILGIVGKSGSGKSTLLRLLNLMELPESGELMLNGVASQSFDKHARRQWQQHTGMVFQQFNLLHNKTVLENVALPLKMLGKAQTRADELLNFVGLSDKADSYPAQLSGGQKQRAALARALVNSPQLLLCDEATSALDDATKQEVLHLFKKIHTEFKPTIVFVSHELASVKQICQRVIVMETGEIVGEFHNSPQLAPQENSYLETVKRSLRL